MSQSAAATLNLTGTTCPAPLLGAKKVLEDLELGQTLNLISDCPGTHDDLIAWCQITGNLLISATQRDRGGTVYLLQKAKAQSSIPQPDATLDLRGIVCPGPILESKKLLKGMKSGEVLKLVSNCSAAADDIRIWSQTTSIELLLVQQAAQGASAFYLRKH